MKPHSMLALVALVACGGNQAVQQQVVPEPLGEKCTGNAFVSVLNDWDKPVEIYAYSGGSATGSLLGTALPGSSSEFLLPRDAVGAAATTGGLTGPVEIPSRARSLVRLRYLCR